MDISRLIREAFANLFAAKLRSILTLLGVLIGTASVVALVSSGQLATQHALAQFKTLGTDLLAVSINAQQSGGGGGGGSDSQSSHLDLSQMPALMKASPDILEIAPYTNYFGQIIYRGTQIDGGIIGATEQLQDVVKIGLSQGRFVSYLDKYSYYCVIGSGIAEKLRAAGGIEPLGQQIQVDKNVYTIIGVAKPWPENMFMFADIDNSLIVPIENSFMLSKYVQIQNIIFKLKPDSNSDLIVAQLTKVINNLIPGQQVFPRSAKQLIASMEKQRATLTLLLSFIGGISLLVGGIGVMNIMLVSVAERRHEIGIRMAIGATGKDIGLMFITEAIVLTVIGGLLGIITGVIISFATAEFSGWGFQFYVLPPLVGFLVSALVGIFSGTYPAYKASKLDPITTLRA